MAALTRVEYAKLSNEQLLKRYRDLDRDTSTQTMEEECARMFALQEIGAVLFDRQTGAR